MATESPRFCPDDTDTERKTHDSRLTRRRWCLSGFGAGIVLGFALTGIDFLIRGWPYLTVDFGVGLIVGPMWCAKFAGALCPVKKKDLPKQAFRLRTSDIMLLIAYIGLWLGMVVTTAPLSTQARTYRQRAINARSMAEIFQNLVDKSKTEIKLRKDNLAKLRERKVPDRLIDIQRDFLRKLDAEGPSAFREERYRVITDGESTLLDQAVRNESTFRAMAKYYSSLNTKYEAAMKAPWIEVLPDPGVPTALAASATTPTTTAASKPPAPTETKPQSAPK